MLSASAVLSFLQIRAAACRFLKMLDKNTAFVYIKVKCETAAKLNFERILPKMNQILLALDRIFMYNRSTTKVEVILTVDR